MVVRPRSGSCRQGGYDGGWFNPTKGYGFIAPQDGGRNVFVRIAAVERAGLSSLNEGQVVDYEVQTVGGESQNALIDRDTLINSLTARPAPAADWKHFAGIRSRQQCRSSSQGAQKENAARGRFS
jgi:CspA family cold shock protein